MPLPRQILLFALPACLVPGLLLAAATSPAPVGGPAPGGIQYTIQPGDTLSRIAQKHGLTPDALAQANAIDKSQRIMAGNVLRLPVTPPAGASPQPVPFQPAPAAAAAGNKPEPDQAPPLPPGKAPEASGVAAAKRELPAGPAMPTPAATPPPAAKGAILAKTEIPPAKAEAPVPPPAQSPGPEEAFVIPDTPAKLASGVYTNPVLGTLRLNQTATGLAMTRDNQTIAMRHLLYGVFDGSDSGGAVHGVRLEFDNNGQVTSLLYSSGSAKDIPFNRAKK